MNGSSGLFLPPSKGGIEGDLIQQINTPLCFQKFGISERFREQAPLRNPEYQTNCFCFSVQAVHSGLLPAHSRLSAITPVRAISLIPNGWSMLVMACTLSVLPVTSTVRVFCEMSTIFARKTSTI